MKRFLHDDIDLLKKYSPNNGYNKDAIWQILKNLYNPKNEFPQFIEIAIVMCQLYAIDGEKKIDLRTLSILLSASIEDNVNSIYISKAWIASFDERYLRNENRMEYVISEFLCVLCVALQDSIRFVRLIKLETVNMQSELKRLLPKIYSETLLSILSNNFCLRNATLESELGVTLKTAIAYLKVLSENGFLKPVKISKNVYYLNIFFI